MKPESDIVIHALKQRYFALLPKENYPLTPEISRECDLLEEAIRNLQPKTAPAQTTTR
jgi:hypothetical protein